MNKNTKKFSSQTTIEAIATTFGNASAISLATAPLISVPLGKFWSSIKTQALSSKRTLCLPRLNSFLCLTITAFSFFFFISSFEAFFTATVTIPPTPTLGYRLNLDPAPATPIISTIFAPLLSSQTIWLPIVKAWPIFAGSPKTIFPSLFQFRLIFYFLDEHVALGFRNLPALADFNEVPFLDGLARRNVNVNLAFLFLETLELCNEINVRNLHDRRVLRLRAYDYASPNRAPSAQVAVKQAILVFAVYSHIFQKPFFPGYFFETAWAIRAIFFVLSSGRATSKTPSAFTPLSGKKKTQSFLGMLFLPFGVWKTRVFLVSSTIFPSKP
jgi:hypothetical protein